jgi:hypothetical protein
MAKKGVGTPYSKKWKPKQDLEYHDKMLLKKRLCRKGVRVVPASARYGRLFQAV